MPLDYDSKYLKIFTLDLIDKYLKESGVVTLIKRKLPLEMMMQASLVYLCLGS